MTIRSESPPAGIRVSEAALDELREQGHAIVVVLGQSNFYARFGFTPAHLYGIGCQYDVSADVFMITTLEPGALDRVKGTVKYHRAFSDI